MITDLNRAATLIRERAQAANAPESVIGWHESPALRDEGFDPEDADHIAGMSPAVALAVADQLEAAAALASWKDQIGLGVVSAVVDAALQVAHAYLGEES